MCTDYEGLCKSVLEAMMVGIPVLCSDVPALNGYIDHGINGFLVNNEYQSWSKELKRINSLPEDKLTEVTHSAKKYVKEKYDPVKNLESYILYFKSLLEDN